jgi:hypothetical protein
MTPTSSSGGRAITALTPAPRTHVHAMPRRDGHCPMCGRRLRLGSYCGYDGYHTDPARCLSCRTEIHAPSLYAVRPIPAVPTQVKVREHD